MTSDSLRLDEVSVAAGHTLVHFLFTGTYQCLKPAGLSPQVGHVAEYETSVQVYSAARTYEVKALVELAKNEIERLGEKLDLSILLEATENVFPHPCADDTWFIGYLKSRSKALLTGEATLQSVDRRQRFNNERSINGIVLESILDSRRAELDQTSVMPALVLPDEAMGSGEIAQTHKLKAETLKCSDLEGDVCVENIEFTPATDDSVNSDDDWFAEKRKVNKEKRHIDKHSLYCKDHIDAKGDGWMGCEECCNRLRSLAQDI